MRTVERRAGILEELNRSGSLAVADLAQRFGVSHVTIRADLNHLADNGTLLRTRGGAVRRTSLNLAANVQERSHTRHSEKVAIARAALPMIEDGQTIILDGGTTTLELARLIPDFEQLAVITPSLAIATQLAARKGIELHILGGHVSAANASATGGVAEAQVGEYLAHQVFLGANAIDDDLDVVDISTDFVRLKRAMAAAGRRVTLMADSSKWGMSALSKVMSLADVTCFITDRGLPADGLRRLSELDVAVICA